MVKSLDEVIERLQYKADNIKAKLEPSYFTECIDYLKTLPRVEEQEIRNKAIDELKNKICMHFADWQYSEADKVIKDIIELASESVEEIAEQMKEV